jgi:hypothetical protein
VRRLALAGVVFGTGLSCAAARAQDVERCLGEVRSYDTPSPSPTRLELDPAERGALLYLPVRHTNDPGDPQLQTMEREWRLFRPTVVLYEGHRDEVAADRDDTVRRFGEPGWVRHFAHTQGVPARRLEPSPAQEVAHVRRSFSDEEVQITYLLLEVLLARERRGKIGVAREQAVEELLRGRLHPAIPSALETRAELDDAFARHFGPGHHWSDPPARWLDPFRSGAETGGGFTNGVVRAATEYRDRHMFRTLIDTVKSGERVLAVVGETHVAMQAPALRCALR